MGARLKGIRVLVTRPRRRSEELCSLLEAEGAEVIVAPLLELAPPDDPRPLHAAARDVHRYAWVVFASPSAVEALVNAAGQAGTLSALKKANVAVVGPKTAQAAREFDLRVDRQAQTSTGRGVFEAIRDLLRPTDEVLLPAAQEGRLELKEALDALGVKVTRVAAYSAQKKQLDSSALSALSAVPPRVVLFGSPRTAEAFLESTADVGRRLLSQAKVVAIGPTTGAALEALSIAVSTVADQPTSAGLVDAVVRSIRG